MRSAGGTYDMKEVECRLMRKQFHGFEIKILFIGFERCVMLSSLNINFLLIMISSVLMKHHELLMSQSSFPLSIFLF
jgi:hypothetical protein